MRRLRPTLFHLLRLTTMRELHTRYDIASFGEREPPALPQAACLIHACPFYQRSCCELPRLRMAALSLWLFP